MDLDKIQKLLIASANGWASEADLQELEAALLADPALRDKASDWLIDESLLRSEASCLSAIQATSELQLGNSAGSKATLVGAIPQNASKKLWMAAAAGVGFLACSLLVALWQIQGQPADQPLLAAQRTEGARLVRATGCVWESEDSSHPLLGNVLAQGETVKLIQGIAEFVAEHEGYSSRIRLQGPAVVDLVPEGLPNVQSGRLIAHITLYGEPFTWDSPLGQVEILESASIGVDVSPSVASIHILNGAIRLVSAEHQFPQAAANKSLTAQTHHTAQTYHAGEAVRVNFEDDPHAGAERIAADLSMFLEEQSMATDQLDLGPEYARLILKAKPTGYWRFEEPFDEAVGILKNEVAADQLAASGNDSSLALRVIGSVARVRQGDNHALEFGMTKDSGWLLSQELWPKVPLNHYTMECWFKPSHYHNGAIFSLVNPEQSKKMANASAILVEIGGPHNLFARHTRKNAIRFVNRSPALFGVELGEACQAEEYGVREWQHLVVVKEGEALRLHLNGEIVATATDPRPVPIDMRLVIGQIFTERAERPFIGQLDEVAIYEHALSTEEIERHYRFGKQVSKDERSI